VAVGVVVLLVLGGVALTRGGQRPPARFALAASPTPTAAGEALAGTWVVDAGSEAGYRVRERFAGQSADSEAVARTDAVTGQMLLARTGSAYQLQEATFSADISKLKSTDANAIHNGAVRDNFVGRIYLETAVFPMATFVARPTAVSSGTLPADLELSGSFTVHGVTHDLATSLKVTRNGGRLEVLGAFPLHYPDYKIDVPSVPFTSAQPDATVEVHLFLKRSE
jgi:polyisoprenoid-binding protein YceI